LKVERLPQNVSIPKISFQILPMFLYVVLRVSSYLHHFLKFLLAFGEYLALSWFFIQASHLRLD
jgi:hypothetical protein